MPNLVPIARTFVIQHTDDISREDSGLEIDGRPEGRKRAYAREPCVGPWKMDPMDIPFFLSYGAPLWKNVLFLYKEY